MSSSRSAMATLVAPRDAQRIENARGSIAVWEVGARVYLTEVRGYMTADMAKLIIDRIEPMYERVPRVYGVHNWLDMENYDSSCRVDLTAWVLRHRSESVLHIGLKSRMVAMGVTVANLALGSLIHVHPDMAALEKALAESLAAR